MALNEALNVTPGGRRRFLEPKRRAGAAKDAREGSGRDRPQFRRGRSFWWRWIFTTDRKTRLFVDGLKLEVPEGWGTISDKTKRVAIKPGENIDVVFRLKVPKDAAYTRPYWHRDDPETESLNHIDDEKYATLPFPPPVLRARVEYSVARRERRGSERMASGPPL